MILTARNRLCTRRLGLEIVHIAQFMGLGHVRQYLHLKIKM